MAVIFFAPKGSAGCVSDACGTEFRKDADARETKFRKGIDAYGPEVIDEIQSFLKEALKRYPQIDANRIGVTGSGYAGFLTHRLISETADFAAAVVQRAWVNPASSYGLGDMEFYREELEEKTFQEFMENRVRKSILKNIRKVQIPVLLLHGEADQICALEQSEQVYHLLRSMHPELPVRIVIFPGEGHDLLQNGLMHNRIRHMQELVAWFETYLSGEGWKREV
jgi:dipeptidyl aminopeptidase/acylaminoacyl peptidase